MGQKIKKVAVIVAHPDDETLWSGGTILNNPNWDCFVITLCRKDDTDRSPKFYKVLEALGATGAMGSMNDGPDQYPLPDAEVEEWIIKLLPSNSFDLIITHSIYGEYTRHRRHEEIGRAVIRLWYAGTLSTDELRVFAYDDLKRTTYPLPLADATIRYDVPAQLWDEKYRLITEIYGFKKDSWEAQATPRTEAFRQFFSADAAFKWLNNEDVPQ